MTCPQPRPRQYHSAVVLAGDVYVFGGLLDSDSSIYTQQRAASGPGGAVAVDAASPSSGSPSKGEGEGEAQGGSGRISDRGSMGPVPTSDVWSCNAVTASCNLIRPTLQHCQPAIPTIAHARPMGMPPPPPEDPHPVFSRSPGFYSVTERSYSRADHRFHRGMRQIARGVAQPAQPVQVPIGEAALESQQTLFNPYLAAQSSGGTDPSARQGSKKRGGLVLAQLQGMTGHDLHSRVIHGLHDLDAEHPLGMDSGSSGPHHDDKAPEGSTRTRTRTRIHRRLRGS